MSHEVEEFLRHNFQLRQTLSKVLPSEVVNYIVELIAKDLAHRNFLDITNSD